MQFSVESSSQSISWATRLPLLLQNVTPHSKLGEQKLRRENDMVARSFQTLAQVLITTLIVVAILIGELSPTLLKYLKGVENVIALDEVIFATRLNDGNPIITRQMFVDAGLDSGKGSGSGTDGTLGGRNINGPTLIRVPSWLKPEEKAHPTANYYLYFASHEGSYIRLAWAATIEGPYHLFNTPRNKSDQGGYGVLDAQDEIVFENGKKFIRSHCASPDVIVDGNNHRVILFYHLGSSSGINKNVKGNGWFDTGGQVTYSATSYTGLNFNGGSHVKNGIAGEPGVDGKGEEFGIKPQALANAYLRTFQVNGHWYGFTNYGPIWKGPSLDENPWDSPWTHEDWPVGIIVGGGNPVWMNLLENFEKRGPAQPRWYAGFHSDGGSITSPYKSSPPKTGAPRHFATRMRADGKTLEVYYTSRGEKPESIYQTTMTIEKDTEYHEWTTNVLDPDPDNFVHQRILFPELKWEGADVALAFSKNGAEHGTNALRDPFVFTDTDGQVYLLYSGGPESAIGLAKLGKKHRNLRSIEDN